MIIIFPNGCTLARVARVLQVVCEREICAADVAKTWLKGRFENSDRLRPLEYFELGPCKTLSSNRKIL